MLLKDDEQIDHKSITRKLSPNQGSALPRFYKFDDVLKI